MAADHHARDVGEIIAEIRRLRLALTIDLSAAAGALDADETEVAADIISAAGSPSVSDHEDHDHRCGPNYR